MIFYSNKIDVYLIKFDTDRTYQRQEGLSILGIRKVINSSGTSRNYSVY